MQRASGRDRFDLGGWRFASGERAGAEKGGRLVIDQACFSEHLDYWDSRHVMYQCIYDESVALEGLVSESYTIMVYE